MSSKISKKQLHSENYRFLLFGFLLHLLINGDKFYCGRLIRLLQLINLLNQLNNI